MAALLAAASLGVRATPPEEVADQKVRVVFLKTGEAGVELLESTSPDGPIGKFVAKRGEGIHHMSFLVDDLEAALLRLLQVVGDALLPAFL